MQTKFFMSAAIFLSILAPVMARADLSSQFDQRDPVLQAKIRAADDRLDRNTDNTWRQIQRVARSGIDKTGDDPIECTLDGSVPQLCYYKMANGLICETKTIDNRLVAKVRCN